MLLKNTQKFLLSVGLMVILALSANTINAQDKNQGNGGTSEDKNGCAAAHLDSNDIPTDSNGKGSNNASHDGINGPSCKKDRDKDKEHNGGGNDYNDNTPTPEPITMLLFGTGLAGVGYVRRKFGKDKDETNAGE
jgi:hypothetical protein